MRALNVPKKSEAFGLGGSVKVDPMAQPQPSDDNVAWSWEVEFNARHRKHGTRLFILDAAYEEMYGCDGWNAKGFAGRANYKIDAVRVSIPRHCLAVATPWDLGVRPKWVRVSVNTASWDWDPESGGRTYHDGLGSKPWTPFTTAHYTRRLYPGTPAEAVGSAVTGRFSSQPSIAGVWAPVAGAWARLAPMISTRVLE